MEEPKDVGLVLEGGGFRGMFTAGVLDFFLQEHLHFDYVVGVSAGAAYGSSYVSRQFGRNLEVNKYVSDPRYCSWFHLLNTGDYFNVDFVYRKLPDHLVPFDYENFSKHGTCMKVALTDCATGEAAYKAVDTTSKERFATMIAATSSLPFLARPKLIDGHYYLDGGIADSIPVQQALKDGNKRLVVILSRDANYRKAQVNAGARALIRHYYRHYPLLAKAMLNRAEQYNRTLDQLSELEKEGQVYVIRPPKPLPVSRMENKPYVLEKVYRLAFEQMKNEMKALNKWLI
jgi:predicted patatin/cPLA2 family phospholipase